MQKLFLHFQNIMVLGPYLIKEAYVIVDKEVK